MYIPKLRISENGKRNNMLAIPLWKRWASYFREFTLESLHSDYNGTLDIILSQGRLQLCTQEAIYSFDDKYDNFVLGFNQINWEQLKPKNVLVLGLGLASIPYILEKKMGKDLHYTAVEIDDAVIELASKYATPRLTSPIDIYQADGYVYVQQCKDQYDLILLDIFVSDKIPQKFQSVQFFELLDNLLTPNGIILSNRLANTKLDKEESNKNYEIFKIVFPNAKKVSVKGNYIFFSDRQYLHS